MSLSTGLISSLKLMYASYGGWRSLLKSSYFWLGIAATGACWRYTTSDSWAELSKDVLPTLAGFSIAAYAVFFAVLDGPTKEALRAPSEKLGGRSPLLILASAVSHGVFVQMVALILAIIYLSKPFPNVPCSYDLGIYFNQAFSTVGLFLTLYGILLVIASVLSIYRVLDIQARV